MTKEELIAKLKELEASYDYENGHIDADKLLLDYINDPEVSEAFEKIGKWYA